MARLLAAQMTAIKIGPGFEASSRMELEKSASNSKMEEDDEEDLSQREEGKISTLIGGTALGANENEMPKKFGRNSTVTLMPAGTLANSLRLRDHP